MKLKCFILILMVHVVIYLTTDLLAAVLHITDRPLIRRIYGVFCMEKELPVGAQWAPVSTLLSFFRPLRLQAESAFGSV